MRAEPELPIGRVPCVCCLLRYSKTSSQPLRYPINPRASLGQRRQNVFNNKADFKASFAFAREPANRPATGSTLYCVDIEPKPGELEDVDDGSHSASGQRVAARHALA